MSPSHFFFCFAFMGASLPAAAIEISLNAIPGRVLRHNPDLAAARLSIDEAKGRLLGSGRPANPELGLSFKHDSRFDEGSMGVSLSQALPLTKRLRLERNLSRQLVAAAELEVENAARKLIAEAQTLAINLLALDQQHTLREQQLNLARKLSEFAAARANTGEISALDAAQAQVDSQRLILEGRKLEAARVSLIGQLKPKLGIPPSDKLTLAGPLPPISMPREASWQNRPDYRLTQVHEHAAGLAIDLAKSKRWEDISVALAWEGEREEEDRQLKDTGFLGLQFSIPLPVWNRNEGEIAEKTAAAAKARLETQALGAAISGEAAAARAEMTAYAKLAKETRDDLLPLVIQQTDRLEKAYQSGQTDLLTLLRAREQRLQLEAAVLEATRDFHLARIHYEAATKGQ